MRVLDLPNGHRLDVYDWEKGQTISSAYPHWELTIVRKLTDEEIIRLSGEINKTLEPNICLIGEVIQVTIEDVESSLSESAFDILFQPDLGGES